MEYLSARYDTRKSFYKKAIIKTDNETKTLLSYSTPVFEIKNNKGRLLVQENLLTQTTIRHIKEFIKQFLFFENKNITKKDIIKNYK